MENGKGKGPGETNNIIDGNFGSSEIHDRTFDRKVTDRIKPVTDLIHQELARPAELSGGSSIPPRSDEAKVIKLSMASRRKVKRTVFSDRSKQRGNRPMKLNDLLVREKERPVIDSIAGGKRQQIMSENMAEEDARAKKYGYAGVRKVYLMIQNTLPERSVPDFENVNPETRTADMAEKIKTAVQELEKFYSFRDEDDEPIFTDNPRDPRLFNAVASILIRVWGHNYLTKLNDLRVNTIVLLLNQGDVSWRKLIDLMVEWEKMPSVARTVNRYNR